MLFPFVRKAGRRCGVYTLHVDKSFQLICDLIGGRFPPTAAVASAFADMITFDAAQGMMGQSYFILSKFSYTSLALEVDLLMEQARDGTLVC